MQIYNRVLKMVSGVKGQLITQIETAVRKRSYSNVSGLLSVLEKVDDLIQEIEQVNAATAPEPASKKAREDAPTDAKRRRRTPSKRGYPRFERNGNNLIKIEWNARKNTEQTHRVPYPTVSSLVSTINKTGGDMFKKDLLTGAATAEGNKIPAHQLGVVMGWLISSKAIVRKGRGDYIPSREKLAAAALMDRFNQLAEREKKTITPK